MDCQRTNVGAVAVLSPRGPLAQDDAERFAPVLQGIIRETYGRVVLDLSGVPLVDSRGLEVLLDATDELASSGRTLRLCGGNELIREVLELTELASQFEYYADAHAAARSFL